MKKIYKQLSLFALGCAVFIEKASMGLKFITVAMNGLVLFLSFNIVLLRFQIYGNINFTFTKSGRLFIVSAIIFPIFNTCMLVKSRPRDISKIISQNLIFSTTFVTLIWGAVNGVDQILFLGISPHTSLSMSFLGVVTLWNNIIPYLNNFSTSLKHVQFLRIFCLNIILLAWNLYFDYTQIKTLGLTLWIFLFVGSTFWQIHALDEDDSVPIVSNYLNSVSSETRKMHKHYFSGTKRNL